MDQNLRLATLNLTCFVSFIIFWIIFITTIMYSYCWTYIEFWFETKLPTTPYRWFVSLFGFIGLWLGIELLVSILNRNFTSYKVWQYIICSLFISLMTIFFINFKIHYDITQNKATPHDLLMKSRYFEEYLANPLRLPRVEVIKIEFADGRSFPEVQKWQDYLYQQTCEKRIDITNLSKEQRQKLWTDYQLYIDTAYEKAGFSPEEYR